MFVGDCMINSLEEFKKIYPKAAVVNYDIADLHGYGLTYRTNDVKRPIEKFRTYLGRYITYPQIQPYSKLNTDYKIFIIRNNKMYELEKGSKELTFHIKEEVTNVDLNIFTDKFYISKNKHEKSRNNEDEPIYRIEEDQ